IHNYSRVGVISQSLTGDERQSNVDRPPSHQRFLREKGVQVYMLKLQGYIFFGTANTLLNDIRQRVQSPELAPLRFAVLYFHRVSRIDSSAVLSLARACQRAVKEGFTLVLTHLPVDIRQQLARGGFAKEHDAGYHIFPDLDHGIEWCEEQLLQSVEPL